MVKRANRSDKYQYLLLEMSYDYDFLCGFSNSEGLGGRLNPFEYDERIWELNEELKTIFWEMVEKHLTPLQKAVCHMTADGYTQMEIAKHFGIQQSNVTKCLNGNLDYGARKSGKTVRSYGGIVKKIRKLLPQYPRVQEILEELQEIKNERL